MKGTALHLFHILLRYNLKKAQQSGEGGSVLGTTLEPQERIKTKKMMDDPDPSPPIVPAANSRKRKSRAGSELPPSTNVGVR